MHGEGSSDMANFKPAKIERINAEPVSAALSQFVRDNKLVDGLVGQAVLSAWDEATKAGKYTVSHCFKGGVFHANLSSSVVRSHLLYQKEAILEEMNRILSESFISTITGNPVRIEKIILH